MTRAWPFVLVILGSSAGCAKPSIGDGVSNAASHAVTVDDKGFTPSSLILPKDKPSSLVFTRTTDATCAREVVFPEINVTKSLPLNTPVTIDLPAGAPRTLTFQCGMAMFKSKVVIQ